MNTILARCAVVTISVACASCASKTTHGSVGPRIPETFLSSNDPADVVKDALAKAGINLHLWDFSPRRVRYLSPPNDQVADGWRVYVNRVVFPERTGEARYLPFFKLDVTITDKGRICYWFSHDDSLPSQLAPDRKHELNQVENALKRAQLK